MWLIEEIFEWLFYRAGGLLSWLVKGCRTSLKGEMSADHRVRNTAVAIFFFILILIFAFLLFGESFASEDYNEQKSTITLFYETLNKEEPSVSDFFRLFGKGNEAELELILRQQFVYLNWKGNWFDDEKALKYVNEVYSNPEKYKSRFLRCIKLTQPMFSSPKFNLQIESVPSVTKDFRRFAVVSHEKKVIFEFSQDEPYIENVYLPDGTSIYTLIEKCVGKQNKRVKD